MWLSEVYFTIKKINTFPSLLVVQSPLSVPEKSMRCLLKAESHASIRISRYNL
jgi:hypothetical protein